MVKCPYDTALVPGTWYLWQTGKKRVFLACPSCGGVAMIELDDLEEDGSILGGMKCRKLNCTFNDQITLIGWKSRR